MTTVVVRHDLPIAPALGDRHGLEVHLAEDLATTLELLGNSDVLVVNNETWNDKFLSGLDDGDWVQTTSMGYEAFPLDEFERQGITFANAADNYTETVAEHATALLLGLARNLPGFIDGQRDEKWVQELGAELTDVTGSNVTIVGLGNIGEAIARRCLPFDCTIRATKRRPDEYDGALPQEQVFSVGKLTTLLPDTDFLVLAVPLTDETHHLIDSDAIEALPKQAFLLNVARGQVVDQDALVEALKSNEIAGAGIDVYREEPLPPDSPLWGLDDVILTPHIAGRSSSFVLRFVDLFVTNVERYKSGRPLRNQIV